MDKTYGLLKCTIVETAPIRGDTPHFHIHAVADGVHFRIAINIKSQIYPYDLLYYIDYDLKNEFTKKLLELPLGFYPIGPNVKKEYGLDYIRGNLIDIKNMQPLPDKLPGPDNDLNEKIRNITHKSLENQETILYAFGRRWGPIGGKDKYFDFTPSDGIHSIHMNQEINQFKEDDDSSWQDGALLINYLPEDNWHAIFLAFQDYNHGNEDTNNA
ncbi:uncharacterized protein YukJ [Clostridium pascui]|uniref:DUF2278 family protein n=1 Tax=Clostridium pascui TaxID=46609 RepID=UPI001958F6F2|nr:uncharacterized protein YukJ [Clostridium pascui]